jgi:hypothetical protein
LIKFKKNIKDPLIYGRRELKGIYRRNFFRAFSIAVIIHLALIMLWITTQKEEKREVVMRIIPEIPPPPIKYIQRAPRMAKDIDVSKTPESAVSSFEPRDIKFERAAVQMTTPPPEAPVKSSGRGSEGSVFYGALTGGEGAGGGGWGIPAGATSYGKSFGIGGTGGYGAGPASDFGPQFATDVENSRGGVSGGGVLSKLRDDLIDYSNFQDRFEGLVQQDPRNKKRIQGFLKFYQVQYRSNKSETNGEPSWNCVPQAMRVLMEYVTSATELKMQLMGSIRMDSKDIFDVPMLYMMGYEGSPLVSKEEIKNLGKYLRAGGFLFVDDGYAAEWGAFNKMMRSVLKDALGYDAIFEKIPPTHPLYHSWEDFSGPPPGEDEQRPNKAHPVHERYRYLEGIFLNGRLAVVFSSKGYCESWGEWRINPASNGGPMDNTRQLQFGINVMVFALTQKGGIIDQTKQRLANEAQHK